MKLNSVTYRCSESFTLGPVSLTLAPGDVLGVVGRNGSGKSTLLRLMSGVIKPTTGDVEVPPSVAYLSGFGRLPEQLTVREAIQLAAAYHRLRLPDSEILAHAEIWSVDALLDRQPHQLSSGQRQRVSLLRALLHDPALVILDEPTTGLDLMSTDLICQQIQRLAAAGKTVVLATHQLVELFQVAQRVVIMDGGQLIEDLSTAEPGVQGRILACLRASVEVAA